MSRVINLSRRDFVKAGAALGGELLLGFHLPLVGQHIRAKNSANFMPNAFIRIGTDDSVTFILGNTEMGQGVHTSVAMLLAEELEVDIDKIRIESAPVDSGYNNPIFGMQLTGGSTTVRSCCDPLRRAGAAARMMLVAAAAEGWGVSPTACRAEKGFVMYSNRRLSYGQLAERASRLQPPTAITLKNSGSFKLLGRHVKRLDIPEKVNGKARFGIDVSVPRMLTALIARPPMLGAKVKNFNAVKAKAVPGVRNVVQIDSGVAVVADGFWPARKGRDLLEVAWQEGPLSAFDTATQRKQYAELAQRPGVIVRRLGDVTSAMAQATKRIEAEYEVPYLAHATMETLNCVADVRAHSCEIWTGTQFQTLDRDAAAKIAGLKPEEVKLHTMLAGGGFGRRGSPDADFVREAVQVSKAINFPVKVIWTREDDLQGGYYRPAYYDKMAAGLDATGAPIAWTHRIVGQSVLLGTPFQSLIKDETDVDSGEGAKDLPYEIPHFQVEVHTVREGPRVWAWRSVGNSHNAFVVESFLDELSHAAGRDPYEFRRSLLNKQPQHKAVLELAAAKAGWGKKLPKGRALGIAVHEFSSFIAQVAEVSVATDGRVKVHRVVCAVDCGTAVDPDGVKAQMEGGIVFGLSATLFGEITFEKGRVPQSNFNDYPLLRMGDMPVVEVYIMPSTASPRGIGESGVPPIAPAVSNAIFAATGKRVRQLPIRPEMLKTN